MAPDAVEQGVLRYECARCPCECAQRGEWLGRKRYGLTGARQTRIRLVELERVEALPARGPG